MLAVMDHNENYERPREQATTAAGKNYIDPRTAWKCLVFCGHNNTDTCYVYVGHRLGPRVSCWNYCRCSNCWKVINLNILLNYVLTGVKRTSLAYQKQSRHWIERPIYVATTQRFRRELMGGIIERRMDPTIKYKDPSSRIRGPLLAANIGLPKPSKEDVRKEHTSRFKARDKRSWTSHFSTTFGKVIPYFWNIFIKIVLSAYCYNTFTILQCVCVCVCILKQNVLHHKLPCINQYFIF